MNELTKSQGLTGFFTRGLNGAVIIKHTDSHTQGVPDISVTWAGMTSWWEVKVILKGRKFFSRATQDEMMRRMGRVGVAFYIIYLSSNQINDGRKEIWIIDPVDLDEANPEVNVLHHIDGHDNLAVVDFVRQLHLAKARLRVNGL